MPHKSKGCVHPVPTKTITSAMGPHTFQISSDKYYMLTSKPGYGYAACTAAEHKTSIVK